MRKYTLPDFLNDERRSRAVETPAAGHEQIVDQQFERAISGFSSTTGPIGLIPYFGTISWMISSIP
ncbi:MAG TPA: hypothetical protein VF503_33465 [Sphingobium sp.]|uniref:hypothetical protein n=1 Tax=Sphingobium sp. TaxID=1912891 RepID=UPI002ED183CC